VPQIWMTYGELGALLDCDAATARDRAVVMLLDRRRSRDGNTRVKLSPKLSDLFLDRMAREWVDREVAACAADLFALRERMAGRGEDLDRVASAAAG